MKRRSRCEAEDQKEDIIQNSIENKYGKDNTV